MSNDKKIKLEESKTYQTDVTKSLQHGDRSKTSTRPSTVQERDAMLKILNDNPISKAKKEK